MSIWGMLMIISNLMIAVGLWVAGFIWSTQELFRSYFFDYIHLPYDAEDVIEIFGISILTMIAWISYIVTTAICAFEMTFQNTSTFRGLSIWERYKMNFEKDWGPTKVASTQPGGIPVGLSFLS